MENKPASTPGTGFWEQLPKRLRFILFGRPIASSVQLHHRLPVFLGLPVFGSDPMSSVAYATEEILIVLAAVSAAGGAAALGVQLPVSLAIAALMLIVATSYRRAIFLYPKISGSYTVSRRNLGATAGMIAGSSLIIDYTLTVAVSVSAGVAALVSYVQELQPFRVLLAALLIMFIAFVNLRGLKESGWWFALPAYSFLVMLLLLITSSLYHYVTGTVHPAPLLPDAIQPMGALGTFVILRAFANGCAGLTGIESVSNGVSAFAPPESKNAARTLLLLAIIMVTLFIGIGFTAHIYQVVPSHSETLLTQLARANFGNGVITALIAYSTLSVLLVAANSAYAGFPLLLAYMARDGYAPRQFSSIGDRLVYTRGIITLAALSLSLVLFFRANVNSLIPLYSMGVFLCFTLLQLGMLRKMLKSRPTGWRNAVVLNSIGSCITGAVFIVITVTKFTEGAWVVVILIPIIALISRSIKRHYQWFERMMEVTRAGDNPLKQSPEPLAVVVLIGPTISRGTLEGIECAREIAAGRPDSILRALHIDMDSGRTEWLKSRWLELVEKPLGSQLPLDIVHSPFRWLSEPVLEYLDLLQSKRKGERIIVVIPEFETGSLWTQLLHNASGKRLRDAVLMHPNVTVVSSRFFLRHPPEHRLHELQDSEIETIT